VGRGLARRGWPGLAGFLTLVAAAVTAVSASGQLAAESRLCGDVLRADGVPREPQASQRGPAGGIQNPDRLASDLFCARLFSAARGGDATGVVELAAARTPFGVAVTPDGHHVNELTAWIEGLPEPSALGPYNAYVAWATPLVLDPVVKLGEVTGGRNDLGRVAFNKFMILITAEASGDVTQRTGPLVLRARSPSSRMEAHDLLAQAPSAEQVVAGRAHSEEWAMPPRYEGVPMLPGVMALRPRVAPLLPSGVAVADLPEATSRQWVKLPNGGTLDLVADLVRRTIRGRELVMLAFNGQHPGPLIRVDQEATIFVNVENRTPYPTSVHWHGLRHDNRFDGVPGVTQDPIEPGETFRYQVHFPDAGIYWYHPHHREDVQQELGLYGNMLVDPVKPGAYGPANREVVLMLDDLLLDDEGVVPFGRESANYMLMGRFGNVFLVNGEPSFEQRVDQGEVVRFFFTNVSNTRTFNVSLRASREDPGSRAEAPSTLPLKVVASDVSRFEREEMVESVVVSPAERYVVDVLFEQPGIYALQNRVQGINHRMGVFLPEMSELGTILVSDEPTAESHAAAFSILRTNADVVADIDQFRDRFDDLPERELVLTLEVSNLPTQVEQSMLYDWVYFNPVEWTGTMPVMNWASTGEEVAWIVRDPVTGRENMDIDWDLRVGDVVKIRVTNDRSAFHAMQHPLHIHGQRFLVLEQNGRANPNLVWKDTVLLPAGSVTDILLDVTNPGRWMVHCHIAEHLESGMKFVFDVKEPRP
jgi:FtsP/CotA-like multicopper oxidase with cupredoxin domain